jgi:capsular exopolysaccharide synthesis family protein
MRTKITQKHENDQIDDMQILDDVPESSRDITLAEIFQTLRDRWRTMAFISCFIMGATVAYLMIVTPKYSAVGQLLIDSRSGQANKRAPAGTAKSDIADVPNEIRLLQSRVLAGSVVDSLGLVDDPEFNKTLQIDGLRDKKFWKRFRAFVDSGNVNVFAAGERKPRPEPKIDLTAEQIEEAEAARIRTQVVNVFVEKLNVDAGKRTRVIDVEFETLDAPKSAKIVNTLMTAHLANQVNYYKQSAQTATAQLEKIVKGIEADMLAAEDKVQAFRTKARLIETKGTSVTIQQLGELNSQLVKARAVESRASARLAQTSQLLKIPGSMSSSPEVLRSPLIQRLREKQVELGRQRSDLSSKYGERHPQMIKIRAEIIDLRSKITDEIKKIVDGITNEMRIAQAEVASLERDLSNLESKAIVINKSEITLDKLLREAEAKRKLYAEFQIQLAQTIASQDLIEPNARIVSYADVATTPSSPQKAKTMAIAGFLSILFSVATVLLGAALRRTFETTDEVERVIKYRALSMIPMTPNLVAWCKAPEKRRSNESDMRLTQAIQNMRTGLYLASESRHPKTILVTSALPREGKSTTAICYASFCASVGQKVLFIDCDLVRPSLHELMGVPNDSGIVDVVSGNADLESVIHKGASLGFDFITAGKRQGKHANNLDASAVEEILNTLAWDYDAIILDSSPVLAYTDTQVLAKLVDSTVLVLQWRKTKRDALLQAVRRLESMGNNSLAGFVLSMVHPRRCETPETIAETDYDSDMAGGKAFPWGYKRLLAGLGRNA